MLFGGNLGQFETLLSERDDNLMSRLLLCGAHGFSSHPKIESHLTH